MGCVAPFFVDICFFDVTVPRQKQGKNMSDTSHSYMTYLDWLDDVYARVTSYEQYRKNFRFHLKGRSAGSRQFVFFGGQAQRGKNARRARDMADDRLLP